MDPTKGTYTLNYPGLSFVFPIPTKQIQVYASSSELPMEFPDGTTPVASHVYIFQGSQDWRSAVVPSLTKVLAEAAEAGSTWEVRQEAESVIAEPTKGITIQFPPVPKLTTTHVPILLHVTTPQDLLADLGKPSRIFYKEEDKMRIHSVPNGGGAPPSSSLAHAEHRKFLDDDDDGENREIGTAENGAAERVENEVPDSSRATDFFYNYFHLGIDVLFDGTLQTCKKIVLHGNVPGHFDFQRYKRCPFKLIFPVSPNDTVSEMLGQDQDPSELASPDRSFDTEDGQARGAGDVMAVTVTADMKVSGGVLRAMRIKRCNWRV
ncbi:hypothetical protein BC937DRAFT_90525 [Endogone sp. FLAS-F59071]|nr:hypothetical protein BC937DRAFT_90525 [Endogone sp. FLAS-F59071]|eukprot:RUS22068.1 hypothetical protein BC937DRAFT_90525 [Endogone sp. FLAS-F59071]